MFRSGLRSERNFFGEIKCTKIFSQPLQSLAATNLVERDKFEGVETTLSQEELYMADDIEKKGQQSNQPGQGQQSGQSGQQGKQSGQPGQGQQSNQPNQNQPTKGGQGKNENENEEEDQNRDRQRRAS